jgi:hypothetical protein
MRNIAFLIFVALTVGLVSCKTSAPSLRYSNKPDKQKTYHVILMGGQSNMVGVGRVADLDNAKLPPQIKYFNFGKSASLQQQTNTFGPEVGIAEVLSEQFPGKNFLLIKYAIGGASLLDWAPDYDPEKAAITGNAHFGNMYADLLKVTDSICSGYQTKLLALLWMQGERDARIPEAGKDYQQNFEAFINAIRKDTETPDLPVIYGIVNPPESRYAAVETVRKAQESINRQITGTVLISTDDLEKWDDEVHYSSAGQLRLGRRFGEAVADLLQNNTTP